MRNKSSRRRRDSPVCFIESLYKELLSEGIIVRRPKLLLADYVTSTVSTARHWGRPTSSRCRHSSAYWTQWSGPQQGWIWQEGWGFNPLSSPRRRGWSPRKTKKSDRGHMWPCDPRDTTANYGQNSVRVSRMSKCLSFWGTSSPDHTEACPGPHSGTSEFCPQTPTFDLTAKIFKSSTATQSGFKRF